MAVGAEFGAIITSAGVFRARRIEAGLLNAGSDFDETTTPFAAGLGAFVDFDKGGFIGRAALLNADRSCRTWGMRTSGGVAQLGDTITIDGRVAGSVRATAWSPFLQCGVSIVRMCSAQHGPSTEVSVDTVDGGIASAVLCSMPFYDEERLIPRGRLVDIPEVC